jgi:signal transduction histidine kinase
VFFLQQIGLMLFSVGLSMVSYFVLSVLWKNYSFFLETVEPGIYIAIQLFTILLIFYGLYLIKRENTEFQSKVLAKNDALQSKNLQIQKKNKDIRSKATLLKTQTLKLQELHTVKNKLFSVIAHDLKAPIYALRNLFQYVHDHDLPASEIKSLVPDVVTDLNNTTDLMENLLHWAKSQMGGSKIYPCLLEMPELSEKIVELLRPQAQAKKIVIENRIPEDTYGMGDKDMISLVLRNLVSNAIKYTPVKGRIILDASETNSYVQVFVRDTGIGMNQETMDRVNAAVFYSSKGTCEETGTGLGLMLSREFITRNGGLLQVQSKAGEGSVFSFTLPLPTKMKKVAG